MKKKKLSIRFTALLFLLWMVLSDRSGVGLAILLAALWHELGHLLAAFCLHIPLRGFCFDLLGARLDVCGRMISYEEEWLLAAAGPLTGLLGSLLAYPLWQVLPLSFPFSCASLLLSLFNLLPVRTFDGGRMMESWLLSRTSLSVSRRVMRATSFLFLFLLFAFAVYVLLRAGDGLSLFCFSVNLFSRFFENESCL